MNKPLSVSKINNTSLNVIFGIIIILSSGIPLLLTTGLIASNYKNEKKIAETENKNLKAIISSRFRQLIKDERSNLKIAAQSQDVIDILTANSDTRAFFENRTFGRLSELFQKSEIKIDWALISMPSHEVLFSSNSYDFNPNLLKESTNDIFLINQDIFIYEIVKLDDQNLHGPNAVDRGLIITRMSFASLKKLVPELNNIKSVSKESDTDIVDFNLLEKLPDNRLILVTFILILVSLFISIIAGLYLFRTRILIPLKAISQKLQSQRSDIVKNEVAFLEHAIESYISNLKIQESEKSEKEKLITANMMAAQVAHDIRSPLTALNMVIETIDKLPEEKRILIRNAIQRINDIANDLLLKGKAIPLQILNYNGNDTNNSAESESTVMLSSMIDILISEKRIQYRDKIGVQIEAELSNSYGVFSKIPANEFKRVLSNLINNSVEALENGKGNVRVSVSIHENSVKIEIQDNGKGIPKEIMNQIGSIGLSYGKEGTQSGSGLGLYQAFRFASSVGGRIEFSETLDVPNRTSENTNCGTTVNILIPRCSPPIWFVESIKLPANSNVIVLDDDQSIHSVWQGRLTSIKAHERHISLISFTSVELFKSWVNNQTNKDGELTFLIDYELLGQNVIGLDLIEELNIYKQSILVSSRYDEKNVYERCNRIGVKIIPKAMAGLIPIEIVEHRVLMDGVLIDDDSLVHMIWQLSAAKFGKSFIGYHSHSQFLKNATYLDFDTPIVIDSQLEYGIRGEDIAKEIYDLGFKNIYIGTGLAPSSIPAFSWIKGTIGKDPIWTLNS